MAELAEVIDLASRRPVREPLLTLREVQGLFGFSRTWWVERAAEGLPRHRWAGSWRYRASEVECWIESTGHEAWLKRRRGR